MEKTHFHYWVRYFIILFVGFVVAMTLSFYLVQHLVKDYQFSREQQEISRLQAEQLRGHSNYLVDLTHQFLRTVPDVNVPLAAKDRQWLKMVYRPQLEHYSETLLEASDAGSRHINQLRSGADRALIMALHPDNASVRKQSLHVILDATQTVEQYLAAQGYSDQLQANALEPNWGDTP